MSNCLIRLWKNLWRDTDIDVISHRANRFSLPYELYPRIINIVGDKALIETDSGVCEWKNLADAGIE